MSAPGETVTNASTRVFGNRYLVEEEIGSGGMGRVLRARDLKLRRAVALKVLAGSSHDTRSVRRFEQEARAAGALNHPNIVTVFDFGEQDGEPYIVTEFLRGATLRVLLSGGALSADTASDLTLQLAQGLSAAHEAGIVHRDLKPENLFITEEGRLKILDFGIAKLLGEATVGVSTDTGAVVGTVAYMSPEQVRGLSVDHRSDIFSLGVILHEMLSGAAPFNRASTAETGYAIINDPPPSLPAGVPARLAQLAIRCLAKEPADRLQAAAGIADALPLAVRSPSLRTLRRALVLVLTVLPIALAIATWRWRARLISAAAPKEVVAVLPFTVRGEPQLAYLGEGMVDLLSTTLSTEKLRAVDPHALLASLTREGWTSDPKSSRAVALRFKAQRFVLGSIVQLGPRLRIQASIYDTSSDSEPVREVSAEGERDKMLYVIDDLGAQVRAGITPPGSEGRAAQRFAHLAEATTSSPTALEAYLEGLRAKRQLRKDAARAALERAVAADPSFALAHYTLAQTIWGATTRKETRERLQRALDLRTKLPEQDQQRVEAFAALLDGRRHEAERLSREIVRNHPDDVDGWMMLGEVLVHLAHWDGTPAAAAREPLEHAVSLDPSNAELFNHLLELTFIMDGPADFLSRVDAYFNLVPAQRERLDWRFLRALAAEDRPAIDELIDQASRTARASEVQSWQTNAILWRMFFGSLWYGAFADSERVIPIPTRVDGSGDMRRYVLHLVRGRIKAAPAHLLLASSDLRQTDPDWIQLAVALKWEEVGRYFADKAALIADRDMLLAAAPNTDARWRYWHARALGVVLALLGDKEGAEREASRLAAMDIGNAAEASAEWIRAQAAWGGGRLDAALAALERLQGIDSLQQPEWAQIEGTFVEYLHGDVLFALGRYDEAERWFRTFSAILLEDVYIGPRALRLATIEDKRGNRDKAIALYRRFTEFWSDCDAELRPQVDKAQARLAALAEE